MSRTKKNIFLSLLLLITMNIMAGEIFLDENNDGKTDRWLSVTKSNKWKFFDKNQNNKADESVFYVNDKKIVFLINKEKLDYSKNGQFDIWIENTYKGKDFYKEIRIDSDGDKKVDLIRYEKNDQVYEQKRDEDLDGQFERTEYFENGIKVKESVDTNQDDKADDFYYFMDNKLIKEELDTNYDGKADMWVKFNYNQDGSLNKSTLYKDNNHDGKVDEWHYTNNQRQVIKIEKDTNFDGKVDQVQDLTR